MLDIKLCILNGHLKKEANDYTYISSRGRSVVEYILTPHDCLNMCSNFRVLTCNTLIDRFKLQTLLGSKCKSPDHSVIFVDISYRHSETLYEVNNINPPLSKENQHTDNTTKSEGNKLYLFDNTPEQFMKNEIWKQSIL